MYKEKILKTQFLPFLMYLIGMINWMCYALADHEWNRKNSRTYHVIYFPMLGFVLMFIINQILCEYQ